MPSTVWCDRAPYVVVGTPGEVARQIESAEEEASYVFLDLAHKGPKACTCGPAEGCTACPEVRQVALRAECISAIELVVEPAAPRSVPFAPTRRSRHRIG